MSAISPDFAQRVERQFTALRAKLDDARESIREYARLHAPRFNVFDYIRPDENRLSDILADLLNPEGSHGQGEEFLKLFLARLGVDLPPATAAVRVRREDPTSHTHNPLRRIDIVVEMGSFALAVENKPWAAEQVDQVRDYLHHLRQRYPKSVLVYLSGNGSRPDLTPDEANRNERDGLYRWMTYSDGFAGWLADCASVCRAERVRSLLIDFREYAKTRFTLTEAEDDAQD